MPQINIKPVIKQELALLKDRKVLVTGGSGFLGQFLCEFLIECGAKVKSFDLFPPKNGQNGAIEFIKGDLLDYDDLKAACKDIFAVFHTASPSPLSNNKNLFYQVNVKGTENLIDACAENNVKQIVYTSSASVVFDGTDQFWLDEKNSQSFKPFSAYAKSKLLAEITLLSKTPREISLCILRPHSIFGPGDRNFIPSLAQAAEKGSSRFIIGSGANLVNFTYVENVAYAHCLASCNLGSGSKLDRQCYFLTNKEVVNMWEFLREIYEYLGYPPPTLRIPYYLALLISLMGAILHSVIPLIEPKLDNAKVKYLACHHFYSDEKATKDFGYSPIVSLREGQKRTLESFKHLRNKNSGQSYERSRVSYIMLVLAVLVLFVGINYYK